MRKTKLIFRALTCLFLAGSLFFTGCNPEIKPETPGNTGKPGNTETPESDFVSDFDEKITKDKFSTWALWTYDLKDYKGKKVDIKFSAEAAVVNNTTKDVNLSFPINMTGYPEVAAKKFSPGKTKWTQISGEKKNIELTDNYLLYMSNYDLKDKDATIYLKNISVTVTEVTVQNISDNAWDKVDSLKNAYVDSGIFDHFGFATTMNELTGKTGHEDKATLMALHGNTTSMGNEMKPQWILWNYGKVNKNGTFTASNGKTIDIPVLPPLSDTEHGLGGIGTVLQIAKDKGLQMRGHVLTWHSQTFDWFFCKDYDTSKGLTDKETMTARHEWYIKTVLDYVKQWEEENNNGKHIIYTWDVVNEAVADDPTKEEFYRGSTPGTSTNIPALENGCHSEGGTSRWYQIYQSNDFIINAFRFANKYAPKDVTLCYNDYNEYMEYGDENGRGYKRSGIISLLKDVLSHKDDEDLPTRIDAFGMQSHFADWVGLNGIEDTIKEYLKLGIDLQVTEIDFAWNESKYTDAVSKGYSGTKLEDLYYDHMKLYKKYSKYKNAINGHGITSVTLWAVEDNDNWLNNESNTYYPSLFERDDNNELVAKKAFFAVLEAAK